MAENPIFILFFFKKMFSECVRVQKDRVEVLHGSVQGSRIITVASTAKAAPLALSVVLVTRAKKYARAESTGLRRIAVWCL
jgi:hypothetical protein